MVFNAGYNESYGALYNSFMTPEMGKIQCSDYYVDTIYPQDIIVTRAQLYYSENSDILDYRKSSKKLFKKNVHNAKAIKALIEEKTLADTVIVSLTRSGGGHAVVAYGYDETDNELRFHVYDPNRPGKTSYLLVNMKSGKFKLVDNKGDTYSSYTYDRLRYYGEGTFNALNNEYTRILENAKNGFVDYQVDLNIIKPSAFGGIVLAKSSVSIEGEVDSLDEFGEQLVQKVAVFQTCGEESSVTVVDVKKGDSSKAPGTFKAEVSLLPGINKLSFKTFYIDNQG